ncbi:TPA: 30S ribosomal protein S10 [Candidatus Kaiserbacteria bacterium]|nr:MAG: 30S ribosomal protein S10 [Parcubacteria group bacterium GW2011_GWA1_56_13]KKW45745.1 MAG: 30S ribosomal protein S10 [Parcubacteria group bacterium GW2011_GWB1_57_6]HCR52204.1 30S ribosomal protein S10 [Candidatus Kaiserbacteria bacterium]
MPTKAAAKPKTKPKTKKVAAPKVPHAKAAPKKAAAPAAAEHKLRIRVRAYEHKILDLSVKQIMDTAARFDAVVVGPVPLPTEIKRWTVNRSTFVYKDAREQFEMRVHKRLIDILNPSPKVIEALTNLNLPSGVTIDVKMV